MGQKFVEGTVDGNFWDQNPEIKFIRPFDELYKKDNSSDIMWAIYLTEDPDSKLFRLPIDKRREDALKILVKKKVDWNKYQPYIDAYISTFMSKEKRMFKEIMDLFEKRNKYMMSLDFNVDDVKLDRMMINTKKIADLMEQIKTEYLDSDSSASRVRGDTKLSAQEKGEL